MSSRTESVPPGSYWWWNFDCWKVWFEV